MSCYGCTSKFSFFNKESSCPLCQMTYCSKCMKYKTVIEGASKKICVNCDNKMKKEYINDETDPPALLLKRLESMDDPSKPPVTIYKTPASTKMENLKRGLSEKDQELLNRLQKLKEKRTSVPSEYEIKERLNALQGKQHMDVSTPVNVIVPSKTNSEQADDLMMEYMEEGELNPIPDGVSEIEARLAVLRGGKPQPENKIECADSNSEDEEASVSKVMARALAELRLPDTGELSPPVSEPEESELPWCELCNEDATIRCLSCEGALYCSRCLRESHDSVDMKEHRMIPFRTK